MCRCCCLPCRTLLVHLRSRHPASMTLWRSFSGAGNMFWSEGWLTSLSSATSYILTFFLFFFFLLLNPVKLSHFPRSPRWIRQQCDARRYSRDDLIPVVYTQPESWHQTIQPLFLFLLCNTSLSIFSVRLSKDFHCYILPKIYTKILI